MMVLIPWLHITHLDGLFNLTAKSVPRKGGSTDVFPKFCTTCKVDGSACALSDWAGPHSSANRCWLPWGLNTHANIFIANLLHLRHAAARIAPMQLVQLVAGSCLTASPRTSEDHYNKLTKLTLADLKELQLTACVLGLLKCSWRLTLFLLRKVRHRCHAAAYLSGCLHNNRLEGSNMWQ